MEKYIAVLPIIKDIVTIIATIVAATVAVLGYIDWKRKLLWQDRYKDLLKIKFTILKLKTAIAILRLDEFSEERANVAFEHLGISEKIDLPNYRFHYFTAQLRMSWETVKNLSEELRLSEPILLHYFDDNFQKVMYDLQNVLIFLDETIPIIGYYQLLRLNLESEHAEFFSSADKPNSLDIQLEKIFTTLIAHIDKRIGI